MTQFQKVIFFLSLTLILSISIVAQDRKNIDKLNATVLDKMKGDKKFKEIVLNETKLITQNLWTKEKLIRNYTRVSLEAGKRYVVLFLVDGQAVKEVDLKCIFNKDVIEPHGEVSGPSEIIAVRHIKETTDFTFKVKETAEFTFSVTTWEDLPKEGAFYTIMVVQLADAN